MNDSSDDDELFGNDDDDDGLENLDRLNASDPPPDFVKTAEF